MKPFPPGAEKTVSRPLDIEAGVETADLARSLELSANDSPVVHIEQKVTLIADTHPGNPRNRYAFGRRVAGATARRRIAGERNDWRRCDTAERSNTDDDALAHFAANLKLNVTERRIGLAGHIHAVRQQSMIGWRAIHARPRKDERH